MHKKAIRKEFLFEDTENPTGSTSDTGSTVTTGTTSEQEFTENKIKWSGMPREERAVTVNNLLKTIDGKLKDKVSQIIDDVASSVKMKLIINNNLEFVLMSNGNPFNYNFGDHTKVLISQIGDPKVIDDSGSGPIIPDDFSDKEVLIGSSAYDMKSIADEIANELDSFNRFLFTSLNYLNLSNGRFKMYDVIVLLPLPISIKAFGIDGNPGRGNLYFTESTNDCKNNEDKKITLNTDFDATKLFTINSNPGDKKFVCATFQGRTFKIANNNLTIGAPNFNNYIADVKQNLETGG
jgi:hypothetical protein